MGSGPKKNEKREPVKSSTTVLVGFHSQILDFMEVAGHHFGSRFEPKKNGIVVGIDDKQYIQKRRSLPDITLEIGTARD